MIQGESIRFDQDVIVDIFVLKRDLTAQVIVDGDAALFGGLEADDVTLSVGTKSITMKAFEFQHLSKAAELMIRTEDKLDAL